MICPHCHRTIEEQDHYLMSRDPEALEEIPEWAKWAILFLICFLVIAVIAQGKIAGLI